MHDSHRKADDRASRVISPHWGREVSAGGRNDSDHGSYARCGYLVARNRTPETSTLLLRRVSALSGSIVAPEATGRSSKRYPRSRLKCRKRKDSPSSFSISLDRVCVFASNGPEAAHGGFATATNARYAISA
jgi:hypothetical protein